MDTRITPQKKGRGLDTPPAVLDNEALEPGDTQTRSPTKEYSHP